MTGCNTLWYRWRQFIPWLENSRNMSIWSQPSLSLKLALHPSSYNCPDFGGLVISLHSLGRSNRSTVTSEWLCHSTCPFMTTSFKKEQTSSPQNSGLSSSTWISYLCSWSRLYLVTFSVFENLWPGKAQTRNPACLATQWCCFLFEHVGMRGDYDSNRGDDMNEPCVWVICWLNQLVF